MLLIGTLTSTGCTGTKIEDDDQRESIWISTFNGGYGREWLDVMVKDYNDSHPDNAYKISVRASKDEFSQVLAAIQSGTAIYDMFYSNNYIYKLIDGDYLEPLTELWDARPDGTRTIREMMNDADQYAQAYSDKNGELYALPQQESIRTFIYDHELFLKYGLLFGRDGALIESPTEPLSLGKDGLEGTYDDGHPTTEVEWEIMVTAAAQSLGHAFVYTGKFGMYTNTIYEMISAQYDGVENYLKNWTFEGEYEFLPEYGGKQTFNAEENGYMTARMTGKKVALDFMDKYLACKEPSLGQNPYTNPKSATYSYSHTDAQNDFIISTAKNKTKKNGMLVDGDWWENEAKTTFDALEADGEKDYKFRTHDYRFMTLPYFEGQKENVNVYLTAENMYIALQKKTAADKKAICKDFITFTYQEKYIQNYTVLTGGVTPFDVKLTEEQKAQLSPFTRNFLELYQDRTHNKFVNGMRNDNAYLTARGGLVSTSSTVRGKQNYYMVLNGLYYLTAQEYFDGMYTNRHDNWATIWAGYQKYLNSRK